MSPYLIAVNYTEALEHASEKPWQSAPRGFAKIKMCIIRFIQLPFYTMYIMCVYTYDIQHTLVINENWLPANLYVLTSINIKNI